MGKVARVKSQEVEGKSELRMDEQEQERIVSDGIIGWGLCRWHQFPCSLVSIPVIGKEL